MAKILIGKIRKITSVLLIATVVFLLGRSPIRRELRVTKHLNLTAFESRNRKPELSKPEERKSKPEKELEASKTSITQANKVHRCQPKTNVVFIKTIKTSGSTLTNVLSRYAMKHNLNIHGHEGCLHPGLSYRVCQLKKLQLNYSSLGRSNIITEHILYHRKILSDVMPKDTVYVTQLRHPLAQLGSWLNYRGHSNLTNPVEEFRRLLPEFKFSKWNSWRQMCVPRNVTQEEFQSYLDQLDKDFDLVTITEQFDLSLLLLRRKLCWDISDMLYIRLKKADYQLNHNMQLMGIGGNSEFDRTYQILNPNAYKMYRHFKNKISQLTTKEGSDIIEELAWFQGLQQRVSNYCSYYIEQIVQNISKLIVNTDSSSILHIPASKWGKSHTVDPIECAMMKFHKETFQKISILKDLNRNLKVRPLSKVSNNNKEAELQKLFKEPIHPKYGIPLSVLKSAHAYDLNEHVFLRGKRILADVNQFKVQRRTVTEIERCIAENKLDSSWLQPTHGV